MNVYIEILYDCAQFSTAKTAIISMAMREGWTFCVDYFEEAKKKLFTYLLREYGIDENEVLIYNWKYHGTTLHIIQ